MNNTQIYAVYDSKAEAFLPPFFQDTDGLAIRAFTQAANDQDHNFGKWAEDYTLFQIGEWDPNTGTLFAAQGNRSLGTALTFVEAQTGVTNLNGSRPIIGDNEHQENTPQRSS